LAHAERRLPASTNPPRPADIAKEFRAFLRLEDQRLRMADRLGATGLWTARARSFMIDLLIRRVFQHACWPATELWQVQKEEGLAIVALGSYGRSELAPFSDLDILFLSADRAATQTPKIIERCQHLLWDAGLSLGQRSCTVNDCLPASRTDRHFQTALVNARLVIGKSALYDQLVVAFTREREKNGKLMIETVQHERDKRYQRRGAAIYLQEPNVKESAGGLRDLHCALWVAYAQYGQRTLEELAQCGLIESDQYDRVVASYDFLLRVRQQAHWASGRKTDHLALDLQDPVARQLGYRSSPRLQVSERFMRDYYRHAREVHQFSESLFARAVARTSGPRRWFTAPRRERLDELFSLKNGQLHFDGNPQLFTEDPLLFFRAAALAQTNGADFTHGLREAIRKNLARIDRHFRASNEASRSFLSLLRRRGDVGRTLRLMHDTGLLGRYLPEFDRVSMLIQHDLYHHYTVDEHTLRAIEALDELPHTRDPSLARLRSVMNEVEDSRLLYLALLLHDLGKGGGLGHIPRGARIAERICDRLGLDYDRKAKVIRLVKHHVLMAHLSQRRDLGEPRLVRDFAAQVGGLDVLNMLFLLTYADLNGVGPAVWSDWKGMLLEDLYTRTRAIFTGESSLLAIADDISRIKAQVIESLAGNIPISEIERHFALSPDRYTRTTTAEIVASHLALIGQLEKDQLACRWQDRRRFATELTICARDRHGLFADLAGTLAASGIEILGAEVNTREDGIALDSFILRQVTTHQAVDAHRWAAIESSLRASIKGEHDVAALVERWRTRHAPRRAQARVVTTRAGHLHARCDNEIAETTTVVEVRAPDEHGLAYKIASVLTAFGLDIACARIATEKSDALDVFYVTTAGASKLDETAMRDLEESITNALVKTGS
jgi:[protein-PII] uridylyltransferase